MEQKGRFERPEWDGSMTTELSVTVGREIALAMGAGAWASDPVRQMETLLGKLAASGKLCCTSTLAKAFSDAPWRGQLPTADSLWIIKKIPFWAMCVIHRRTAEAVSASGRKPVYEKGQTVLSRRNGVGMASLCTVGEVYPETLQYMLCGMDTENIVSIEDEENVFRIDPVEPTDGTEESAVAAAKEFVRKNGMVYRWVLDVLFFEGKNVK